MHIPVRVRDIDFFEAMCAHDPDALICSSEEAIRNWELMRGKVIQIVIPAIRFACSAGGRVFDVFPRKIILDRYVNAVCEHQIELGD